MRLAGNGTERHAAEHAKRRRVRGGRTGRADIASAFTYRLRVHCPHELEIKVRVKNAIGRGEKKQFPG
jgi:hypothetical protein